MRRHHLILLLDSDPRRLSNLKLLLETHGYRVLASTNSESALALLAANPVEVLVTFRHPPLASTPPLADFVLQHYPRTSIVFRERPAGQEEPPRPRFRPPVELTPAELLESIRKEFSRRRGPHRALPEAAMTASSAG